MAIDESKIGITAARMMEGLQEKYEDDESAEITSVFLIVAVDHSQGESTEVSWGVSPGMPMHEGLGLLRYVKFGLLQKHE